MPISCDSKCITSFRRSSEKCEEDTKTGSSALSLRKSLGLQGALPPGLLLAVGLSEARRMCTMHCKELQKELLLNEAHNLFVLIV